LFIAQDSTQVMNRYSSGFTLVELMIVVAIIAIISAIAIPAYNNYIREAQFAATKANVEPLRLILEDFWLDNSTYGDGGTYSAGSSCDDSQTLDQRYDWCPDGDQGTYGYSVVVPSSNTYTITVTHDSGRIVACQKSSACTYND